MEAFARSSTTLFAKASFRKPLSPSKSLLVRFDICLLSSLNSNVHVYPTFLLRHSALQSVDPSQKEVITTSETAGIGIQTTVPSKTVHVQFQLHKECKYGESFLVVGNEPVLGQWNPSIAIPLNWSDGNIWTVELDIPVDRAVQYKFILKKDTGYLLWQPGLDRILHTWNTKNTIAITEDWNDCELQKISEVQSTNQNEGLLVNPGLGPIVPGNVVHPDEETLFNKNEDGAKFSEHTASADDKPSFSSKNKFVFEEKAIQSGDGTLLGIRKELRISDNGNCTMKEEAVMRTTPRSRRAPVSMDGEDEETLPTYEGGFVLVPGLAPIQEGVSNGEELPKEHGKTLYSAETLPKELGKTISQQAIPKELEN